MAPKRAGFWWRVGALLLDGLFLGILLLLVLALQAYLDTQHLLDAPTSFVFSMLGYIIPLFYTATEMAIAATPGKLITGLRITNLDGSEAPLARLVSRWTAKWSFLLIGLLGAVMHQTLLVWLGNLMWYVIAFGCFAAAGEAKLAWHDRWAQTAVYRIRGARGNPGSEPVLAQAPTFPSPLQAGAERRETD